MSKSLQDNKRWLISQVELESWLDGISNARTLIAPHMVGGVILYQPVTKSEEITWEGPAKQSPPSGRPVLSVKDIFFPATEHMFTIQKTGQEIHLKESYPDWETVVFAVRPCDAHGIKLLDALFLDTNPVDSFYARRRGNTTLIGLACDTPGATCFCTSVGGAPDDSHDVDIMLFATPGGYLAEAVTEKGRFLIPGGEWKETTEEHHSIEYSGQFLIPEIEKLLDHFSDEYWTKISERCLSCRACAYVCPTCRCFVIRDEVLSPGQIERIRCWDSCAGENYRLVAGGHKPRAEKGERFRNRVYCKFEYFAKQYGQVAESACTGCGRCIDVCPAGVDITEVLMDLEKQE
jgi:sulfhydrogenase subunit beta (sulfur reductase)